MRLLELFSGTHSVGKVAKERGWEVVSLDLENADISCDVLTWDYQIFSPHHFDIIWASPPCETFSNLRRSWIGRKLRCFGDAVVSAEMLDADMLNRGVPILRKTEEIIDYFTGAKIYFIENPRSGKMKNFLTRPYIDVDYCQYGFNYKKPTRIWTNLIYEGKKCVCEGKHATILGDRDSVSTKTKYRIPPKLIEELLVRGEAEISVS